MNNKTQFLLKMGSTYELKMNYLNILKDTIKSGLNIYSECL